MLEMGTGFWVSVTKLKAPSSHPALFQPDQPEERRVTSSRSQAAPPHLPRSWPGTGWVSLRRAARRHLTPHALGGVTNTTTITVVGATETKRLRLLMSCTHSSRHRLGKRSSNRDGQMDTASTPTSSPDTGALGPNRG